MRQRSAAAVLAVFLFLPRGAGIAEAQEGPPRISVTEGHLLAYFNEGDDSPALVGTLQHFSTWRYGSNFFFADVSGGPDLEVADTDLGVYLEYAPVVSLQRVGLVPVEGIELAWSVPRFAVFNTQLLARQERGYHGSWQATWVYDLPLRIGDVGGHITGFMDVWRRTGGGEASTVLLAQPQVLVTLGSPEPGESFVELGVEVEPSHDFPAREFRPGWNVAVSPVVRWVF